MTSPAHAAHAYVGAFVDELARAGVRHVCIAPGSRSTPLALMIAAHPRLRTWMHLDERAAGFFALGMARALGETVALLCTSGSAAANFFPAVVEARSAGVPLLVLTADRPPELRDVGAAQTIDQNALYGAHVKWFVEVALPEESADLLRYARTLAGRAAALAGATPAGPVHLNFPFREPLVPVAGESAVSRSAVRTSAHGDAEVGRLTADRPTAGVPPADILALGGRPNDQPWVRVTEGRAMLDPDAVSRIAERLRAARRPLLVCGPQYDARVAAPLASLATALGAPLLADPLSQLRWGAHDRSAIIDRYDAALRHEKTAASLTPDLVLRVGAMPTSKALLQYLQRHGTAHVIVVNAAGWSDPTLLAGEMVHADPAMLCEALAAACTTRASDAAWLGTWCEVNEAAGDALAAHAASLDEPFEGSALAAVAESVPAGGTLFVSSSMPVRDLDAFAPGDERPLRVLANRGANGIDGIVSTALGVAAAARERGEGPVTLAIGDIAFYHDMNGLLAAKLHALDATIVVINNDGGGIFSFLPQAADQTHFEQLFGTPHGMTFEHAAAQYGARYTRVEDVTALSIAVTDGIEKPGLDVVELRTERTRNVALHRAAWAAVASALEAR